MTQLYIYDVINDSGDDIYIATLSEIESTLEPFEVLTTESAYEKLTTLDKTHVSLRNHKGIVYGGIINVGALDSDDEGLCSLRISIE